MDGFSLTVIGEQAILFGDGFYGEVFILMIGNFITKGEADADKRRGFDGIGAGVLSCGKTDFDEAVFLGEDMAEAESGF